MKIPENCAACLFDQQRRLTDDPDYLKEVRGILESRGEEDSAPYLVSLFAKRFEERFGSRPSFAAEKKRYNDYVLDRADGIRNRIRASADPLETAILYSRIGNYIDFGPLKEVDEKEFLALFDGARFDGRDRAAVDSFKRQLGTAKRFLLITDNCGEIVLDRLLIEVIRERFPAVSVQALVRGEDALNDATAADAVYVGLDRFAEIVSNGNGVAGTVYTMLSDRAREALDRADLVLSKGQGNYETLSGIRRPVFYSFLCKCAYFSDRFQVPRFTGIFLEE